MLCDSVSPPEWQREYSLQARLSLQLRPALFRCVELKEVCVTPGCCRCLWDQGWSLCRAPSAPLIPLRAESEPSSWAVGSLPAPAWAAVSTHNRGCPLGHGNPTLILLAGCFEVPRLEMLQVPSRLDGAGCRDLPSAVPRVHPSMADISTTDRFLLLLEISSAWETQHLLHQGEGN